MDGKFWRARVTRLWQQREPGRSIRSTAKLSGVVWHLYPIRDDFMRKDFSNFNFPFWSWSKTYLTFCCIPFFEVAPQETMDFVKPLMLQGGFGTFIGGHWNREGNQYVIQIWFHFYQNCYKSNQLYVFCRKRRRSGAGLTRLRGTSPTGRRASPPPTSGTSSTTIETWRGSLLWKYSPVSFMTGSGMMCSGKKRRMPCARKTWVKEISIIQQFFCIVVLHFM